MNTNISQRPGRGRNRVATAGRAFARNAMAYLRNAAGSSAMAFGLALPAVMGAAAVGVDFSVYNMKLTGLQAAADQAALAGAKQFAIASSNEDLVQAAAETFAKAALGESIENLTIKASVDASSQKVTVTLEERWMPFFAHVLKSGVTPIVVNATAGLFGESKICVLALGATDHHLFQLHQQWQRLSR
jgi:Flp pilus assembly protein TadG